MSPHLRNVLVVVSAIIVITIAAFLTLFFSGALSRSSVNGDAKGYQSVTFNDAVILCLENTRGIYAKKIQNLVVDDHSSRFDQRQYLYRIFLKMDLYKQNGGSHLHYINCFVSSGKGVIRKYEVFQDNIEKKRGKHAEVEETNMFGMPKRKR